MQLQVNCSNRLTITAKTGHHAPSSGWWHPEDDLLSARYLQQGEIMPAVLGAQTVWTLLREMAPSLKSGSRSTRS